MFRYVTLDVQTLQTRELRVLKDFVGYKFGNSTVLEFDGSKTDNSQITFDVVNCLDRTCYSIAEVDREVERFFKDL